MRPLEIKTLVCNIKNLLQFFEDFKVGWFKREDSMEAHNLGQIGIGGSIDGLFTFKEYTDVLVKL